MAQSGTTRRKVVERSSREILIWIDDYNDIFSDFDPRDYSERNISDDFLHELKRVASESEHNVITLRLLLDDKSRNEKTEAIIIERVHREFEDNFHECVRKRKSYRSRSILFLTIGIIMILGASFFSYLKANQPLMHIPLVILEPAGWFLTWTGFEQIFRSGKKSMPEYIFYAKLSKSEIIFGNIKSP